MYIWVLFTLYMCEQSVVGSNPTLAAHFSLEKRVVSGVVVLCCFVYHVFLFSQVTELSAKA